MLNAILHADHAKTEDLTRKMQALVAQRANQISLAQYQNRLSADEQHARALDIFDTASRRHQSFLDVHNYYYPSYNSEPDDPLGYLAADE